MLQLILDTEGENIALPEAQKGAYVPRREQLSVSVVMVTGRMVRELKGTVWRLSYQYGYFDQATMKKVIEVCEKGQNTPITCGFLPQESDVELTYSNFWVESYERPKFYWSRSENGETIPMWGGFAVELREVEPND